MGQYGCSRTLTLSGTCTPNPQPQAANPDPKQDHPASTGVHMPVPLLAKIVAEVSK